MLDDSPAIVPATPQDDANRPARRGAHRTVKGFQNAYGSTWRQPILPLLRWRLTRLFNRRRGSDALPATRCHDPELLQSTRAHLTWVGHATFILRLGQRVVVTDPVWAERLYYVVRMQAPGVPMSALPPVDVVTVSHNHYDHLHLPTLQRLARAHDPTFVVPLGHAKLLASAGITKVCELDWWQHVDFGELRVSLVPAQHWSARGPLDINRALWGGFVFRSPEGTAYHSGDTAYEARVFRDIARAFPDIDWAMLPIGAYDPAWFLGSQHMGPHQAALAFDDLGAQQLVAMHYGTFNLTDEPVGEPLELMTREFECRGELDRLWALAIGESRSLI